MHRLSIFYIAITRHMITRLLELKWQMQFFRQKVWLLSPEQKKARLPFAGTWLKPNSIKVIGALQKKFPAARP